MSFEVGGTYCFVYVDLSSVNQYVCLPPPKNDKPRRIQTWYIYMIHINAKIIPIARHVIDPKSVSL